MISPLLDNNLSFFQAVLSLQRQNHIDIGKAKMAQLISFSADC